MLELGQTKNSRNNRYWLRKSRHIFQARRRRHRHSSKCQTPPTANARVGGQSAKDSDYTDIAAPTQEENFPMH